MIIAPRSWLKYIIALLMGGGNLNAAGEIHQSEPSYGYNYYHLGQVFAFEGWNEPNLHFLEELPDHLAALQKVWYLGLKDGNSNIKVLSPSFTRMAPQF